MLSLFFFLLFYFIAASEGGANVFEVTYFKGTVSSQSPWHINKLWNMFILSFCNVVMKNSVTVKWCLWRCIRSKFFGGVNIFVELCDFILFFYFSSPRRQSLPSPVPSAVQANGPLCRLWQSLHHWLRYKNHLTSDIFARKVAMITAMEKTIFHSQNVKKGKTSAIALCTFSLWLLFKRHGYELPCCLRQFFF